MPTVSLYPRGCC